MSDSTAAGASSPFSSEEVAPAGTSEVSDGGGVLEGTEVAPRRAVVYNWLLAGVWLVFLASPLLAILADDDLDRLAKTAAVALLVSFCVVYLHGFHQLDKAERQAEAGFETPTAIPRQLHFSLMVAIIAGLYAIVGIPAVGVIPFLVAFAVFQFSWPVAWFIYAVGTGMTFLVPLVRGRLDDLWFLTIIVMTVGGAAVLIRLVDESQRGETDLRTQLAVSDERSRVARDVHDVLGHSLTAVILKAELCQRLLDGGDDGPTQDRARIEACREQLAELTTVSRSALAEIRSTVGGLRAANLADEVTVARSVLADAEVGLLVTGEVSDVPEVHRPVLAWVVREAVTNVVRHAQASQCHIELGPGSTRSGSADSGLLLRVSDDGIGFAQTDRVDGNGLRGLRERVEAAGATLTVRSDDGTTIEVAL